MDTAGTDRAGAVRDSRERTIARSMDAVGIAYLVWMAGHLWTRSSDVARIFADMGFARLPSVSAFLIDNRSWLYPAVFGFLAALVVAKGRTVADRRTGTMVTFLIVVVGQFLHQAMAVTVMEVPVLDAIGSIGS